MPAARTRAGSPATEGDEEGRPPRLAGQAVQFGTFVVILGIPDGLLGVLWPTMHRSLHRPLADLGEAVAAGTLLYLLGGLAAEPLRRAAGLRATVFSASLLGFLALVGWAAFSSWWAILLAIALLGAGKGVLDASLNAVAALEKGVRRLGLLHASWAIGGTLGPVIVATVVAGGDWRAAVAVVAAAAGFIVPLSAVRQRDPLPRIAGKEREPIASEERARRRRAICATVVAFGTYTAAEAGPVSWGATYLVGDRHLAVSSAAAAMAVFWAALTVGRLALALPQRFPLAGLLEASALLFVTGTLLVWLLPGALAVVGLAVAGLGSAAIFPLYMALTPGRLGEEVTGRAVGYSIAGAALGGPIAVSLFGLLAGHLGVFVLAPCLFGAALVMYLAHKLLALLARPGPRAA